MWPYFPENEQLYQNKSRNEKKHLDIISSILNAMQMNCFAYYCVLDLKAQRNIWVKFLESEK
jgi:hypothetical protein